MKDKEQKRAEAMVRQEEYDKLTPQQKLERLGNKTAKKQREKLLKK